MTAPERIQAFIETAKKYHLDKGEFEPWKLPNTTNAEPLNLYPGYADAVRHLHQISIHSTKDSFPEKEFRRLMSNMEEQGIEWLKDNYQPITHTVWNEFINTVTRACYNVSYVDKNVSEDVIDYLREEIPKYQNLFAYFKSIAPKLIAKDAMSVFTVLPESLELEVDEENEGTAVIAGDINPMPQYFECWRVIHFEHGRECLILRPEKSPVMYGNKMHNYGLVFEYYNQNVIERYVQVGKQTEYQFALEWDFTHELGYMPAWRSGGIAEMIDNEVVYKSHFYGAVPHLNNAMEDAMLLKAVKFKSAFPTAVMVVEDCDYVAHNGATCNNGYIKYFDKIEGEDIEKECPRCGGTGKSQRLNPFSTMYVPAANRENPEKYSASDVLSYVSPPTATMEFMRKETDLNLSRAASEIKIGRTINQEGDHVTATEKGIDQKATYAFIYSFSMVWAKLFDNVQRAVAQMKWGDIPTIKVIEPKDFDLMTADDYLDKIKQAQDAGVAPAILASIISDYMFSEVEGSYAGERMIETIIAADRIFQMGGLDALTMGDKLQKWEYTLHVSSYNIVSMLMGRDANWIDKELADRIADVQAEAQALTPETTNEAVDALNQFGA